MNKNDAREVIKNVAISSHDYRFGMECYNFYLEIGNLSEIDFKKRYTEILGEDFTRADFENYVRSIMNDKIKRKEEEDQER